MKGVRLGKKGFLVLEMLIAGLILTSGIAATMYLFKMGFEYLQRSDEANVISSKVPQAVDLLRSVDLNEKEGSENMGDDVTLRWKVKLVQSASPALGAEEGLSLGSNYELYLYKVDIRLGYRKSFREFEVNVFRYKTKGQSSDNFL